VLARGAGFNPILTGRENIYINGSVLGLTKKEPERMGCAEEGCRRRARRASRVGRTANQIDEKIDEIIDFAEIREFIDMPVQSYSSGMAERFMTQKVLIS
jgi:lipopolysaccharide transport system ATP-binding protein